MANRNRKKMSKVIFDKLLAHAGRGGATIGNLEKPRWIAALTDEDSNLMATAEIKNRRKITRQMQGVMFEHRASRYFAFFGFPPTSGLSDNLPEGLTEVAISPGNFGLTVVATDVAPTGTPSEIRDVVEAEFKGVDNYTGHNLDSITKLFPRLLMLQADVNFPYTDDIDRVLGALVATVYTDGPLALSSKTLEAVVAISQTGLTTSHLLIFYRGFWQSRGLVSTSSSIVVSSSCIQFHGYLN
jgi:hypothetical protein